MAILGVTTDVSGLASVNPQIVYILTNDSEATISTPGYLNHLVSQGYVFTNQQMALTYGTDGIAWMEVSVSNTGVITLNPTINPGTVVLPVSDNHIACFVGTTGAIGDDATTAINGGNIQAGLSGTAGYLASFPSTASKGSLRFTATANTGNTVTNVTNAAFGQATTITIPDPGVASASFVLSDGGTQNFATGNIAVLTGYIQTGSSGHAGALYVYPASGSFYSSIISAAPTATQSLTIPNTGTTAASFVLTTTAVTQTITNGLTVGSGLTVSSGNIAASLGDVSAGGSGSAHKFISYPATAANGALILAATDAGANFNTTISNGTMGQSTVYTLPDPSNAVARILVGATATPFTASHILSSSGTGGLVADSGIATSEVQLNTNIKAQQVSGLGGSGAGPLTVTAAGVTASSVICADIITSSNPVSVIKVAPGSGNFALTLSGDPGATLTISYIAFIAAQ